MSKSLNAASLFTTAQSGLNNTYSVLSKTFKDGVTLANLNSTDANTVLDSNALSSNFKSYLSSNFSNLDKDKDGKISSNELNQLTTSISNSGLTREQLYQLGTTSGVSSSLLETVTNYFDEIDTNNDGKVTNEEINAFSVKSTVENQKKEDLNKMIGNMSTFYDTEKPSSGSLLDYKYLQDDEQTT